MTVSEAKRLKALQDENAKLKRLLAEQMLDMAAMKELLSRKWCRRAKSRHWFKAMATFLDHFARVIAAASDLLGRGGRRPHTL
jgi:hypothetical protein